MDDGLTSRDREAYRLLTEGADVPEPDIERLVGLGLADREAWVAGMYAALDPRGAARRQLADARAELERAAARLADVPHLDGLATYWDPERWYSGAAAEFLPTPEEMNRRIGDVSAAAEVETWTAQPARPVDRDPEVQRAGVERMVGVLERGVRARSLYPASAVCHGQTRAYVDSIIEAGAEVRAVDMPFPRMLIIDARHLFIDNLVVEDASSNSGWHVFDRAIVMWARSIFSLFWDAGRRWQDTSPTDGTLSARQALILRELAAGYDQEQTAARVGVGARTVGKELAEARAALGMHTTAQLMAWWGQMAVTRSGDGPRRSAS
ncbi:hypothetical protein [Streptomyces tremellae]